MGHFAEIDDANIVKNVITLDNRVIGEPQLSFPETEEIGKRYIRNVLGLNGEWLQTSYSGSFRGRYAGIGFRYDLDLDEFVEPEVIE